MAGLVGPLFQASTETKIGKKTFEEFQRRVKPHLPRARLPPAVFGGGHLAWRCALLHF